MRVKDGGFYGGKREVLGGKGGGFPVFKQGEEGNPSFQEKWVWKKD